MRMPLTMSWNVINGMIEGDDVDVLGTPSLRAKPRGREKRVCVNVGRKLGVSSFGNH